MDKPTEKQIILLTQPDSEAEFDLIKLATILWKRKIFIIGVSFVSTLVAVWITLFYLPVLFQSQAVILVVSDQSSLGMLSGLGGLAESLPFNLGDTKQDKGILITNVLSSSYMKEKLIKRFNLLPRIYFRDWDEETKSWETSLWNDEAEVPTVETAILQKEFDEYYSVSKDRRSGLITITYLDQNPEFPSKVLIGATEELKKFLDEDYISDAKRHRIFVEGELARIKNEVESWERKKPEKQTTSSEIQREFMAAIKAYAEIRQQFELAIIAESKENIAFKILDHPLVPHKKAKPKRSIICLITMFFSGIFAVVIVLVRESIISNTSKNKMPAVTVPEEQAIESKIIDS